MFVGSSGRFVGPDGRRFVANIVQANFGSLSQPYTSFPSLLSVSPRKWHSSVPTTKVRPTSTRVNYQDVAVLFGLTPCPTPVPTFIAAAQSTGRQLSLVIAHDPKLERDHFRLCNADIYQEGLDLVDGGCNISTNDPLKPNESLTTICMSYHENCKVSKRYNEVFTTKIRKKYNGKRADGTKKFKISIIFQGAHDGSNDAFWTLKAFLWGVRHTACESNIGSGIDDQGTFPFPCDFRITAVDFEGGKIMPRQLGLATIDSESVKDLAYEDWTEATSVRSLFCEEEREFSNPFCLPDTDPQFCKHEFSTTYSAHTQAILDTFARKTQTKPPII